MGERKILLYWSLWTSICLEENTALVVEWRLDRDRTGYRAMGMVEFVDCQSVAATTLQRHIRISMLPSQESASKPVHQQSHRPPGNNGAQSHRRMQRPNFEQSEQRPRPHPCHPDVILEDGACCADPPSLLVYLEAKPSFSTTKCSGHSEVSGHEVNEVDTMKESFL